MAEADAAVWFVDTAVGLELLADVGGRERSWTGGGGTRGRRRSERAF